MNQMLRIACYGYAERHGGSSASANFLILEELLKRGFQIDFYGLRDLVYTQELFEYKNFHYVAFSSLMETFRKVLPSRLNESIMPIAFPLFFYRSYYQALQREILAKHQVKQYDLLLFLGLYSPFKIADIPAISWPQGPPQTEWFFIQKHRNTLIALCGIAPYIQLMVFYALKAIRARSEVKISDILICNSQWTKDQLVLYKVKPEIVKVLPYAIGTDFFRVNNSGTAQNRGDTKVFLWLGRIDPRKRLDLLLKAYALVLQERQDVKLKIVGRIGYAKGYKKLIDNFEFPNHIEYQPHIDRLKVPELMAQCDILVQPSEGENFGLSVAEALCYGLPVIVGPTNGTKDYINPSSFIFEAYNPESLKETMLQAIQAVEQDRDKLTLEARQTAEKNFSVYSIVDRLQGIFQEALTP